MSNLTIGRITFNSHAPNGADQRPLAEHRSTYGRVRLSAKTIGPPLPSQDRVNEDMRPMFDRLWRLQ